MTLFHGTSVFLALQMKIKCEKQIAAIRICRYKHKEIWYTRTACWSCSFSSSTVFAIRTVYASFTRTLQTSHFKEMESYGREKEGLNHVNILLETVDSNIYIYISWAMRSPILVWCHSCLKMPMQLLYLTESWNWSRKLLNIWIQIRLMCWQWASHSLQ